MMSTIGILLTIIIGFLLFLFVKKSNKSGVKLMFLD
jgi:plastocyanin domain-containing protein